MEKKGKLRGRRGDWLLLLWGENLHPCSCSLPLEVSCRVCSSFSASMAAVCCCLMSSLKAVSVDVKTGKKMNSKNLMDFRATRVLTQTATMTSHPFARRLLA